MHPTGCFFYWCNKVGGSRIIDATVLRTVAPDGLTVGNINFRTGKMQTTPPRLQQISTMVLYETTVLFCRGNFHSYMI